MKVLDLCAGRLGIARVFAERGHQVTAVDLVEPPEIPAGVTFIKADILTLTADWVRDNFDFGWASTPCEQFSCFTMKMWQPNPKHPDLGISLFNHARTLFEQAGIPYCMENVRGANGPNVPVGADYGGLGAPVSGVESIAFENSYGEKLMLNYVEWSLSEFIAARAAPSGPSPAQEGT